MIKFIRKGNQVMKIQLRDRILVGLGCFGMAGFLYLYAVKLFGQHGKPATSLLLETYVGRNGLIAINILILACFLALLPYRIPSEKSHWKSKGVFLGFLIALFTEMFGLPLIVYIFSPFFDYPFLRPLSREILGGFGMIAGTWLTLAGLLLVFFGWRKIYRAEALVTDGIYQYIRHPQYAGLFLIIFGWLIHWPTLLTLIIFPILIGIYYWLAIREENELEKAFGIEYEIYKARTPRFVPRIITKNRYKAAP